MATFRTTTVSIVTEFLNHPMMWIYLLQHLRDPSCMQPTSLDEGLRHFFKVHAILIPL